jgi:hypothetical protein
MPVASLKRLCDEKGILICCGFFLFDEGFRHFKPTKTNWHVCDDCNISPGFPVRYRPNIENDDHRTDGKFSELRESALITLPQTESRLVKRFSKKDSVFLDQSHPNLYPSIQDEKNRHHHPRPLVIKPPPRQAASGLGRKTARAACMGAVQPSA